MPLADKKPTAAVLANQNALNSFSEKFKFDFWAEESTNWVWLLLQIIKLIFEIIVSEKLILDPRDVKCCVFATQ